MLPTEQLAAAIKKIPNSSLREEIEDLVAEIDTTHADEIESWRDEANAIQERVDELEDAEELADEQAAANRRRTLDVRKWALEDAARACAAAGEPVPERFLRELAHHDYVVGVRRAPV